MSKQFKKILFTLILICFSSKVYATDKPNFSADEALQKLKQGNKRFAQYHMKHPDEYKLLRKELVKGQHPFAAILSCSDSRVPTEIIFDQGLGDLFVIRNAGNVLDEHILGSIEYAVEHLGVNLVVIMGHESCGAVGAAMKCDKETEAIESIKEAIEPAVEHCKQENKLTTENVVKEHVKLDIADILKDKELHEYIQEHNVKILPAYYSITTGKVEFLN